MTLIAALDLHGVPVLLGDIIVSQIGESRTHAATPTRTDVKDILPEEWLHIISGVKRKVVRINDWLAIGWTGHLLAATHVLKEIKDRFWPRQPDRDELFRALTSFEGLGNYICLLLGWLVDKKGKISFR